MNNPVTPSNERGQAIVIMAVAMIVILGFAGLAIDGGNLYAQRRHGQISVDNATLAYGLSISRGETTPEAENRARQVLIDNGLTDSADNWSTTNTTAGGIDVVIGTPANNTIKITLTQTISTAFIHLVYRGPAVYTVSATAKGTPAVQPFTGFGIALIGICSGNNYTFNANGGGNSGGANVYDANGQVSVEAGIVTNLPSPANSACAFDPPNSNSNQGISSGNTCNVGSASGNDFGNGSENIVPAVTGNCNNGEALTDPYENITTPVCDSAGYESSGTFYPGNWDGGDLQGGIYQPGIYCITGDVHISSGTVYGSGVIFYFINGGMDFSGQSHLEISAPYCEAATGYPANDACSYSGMVIWSGPNNTSGIDIGGNGGSTLVGTIYLPKGTLSVHGGGNDPTETVVTGQIIANSLVFNGNASLRLFYDETKTYILPPTMQLIE